jgi:hypothetical protein
MKKQKNTTKPIKERKTKRERSKYPALNKSLNISSRKDYIETDYVRGIYDSNSNELIRPLNTKEKEWLNKFYEETVVTNFYHDPELKRLLRKKKEIVEDSTVKKLKDEVVIHKEKKDKKRVMELKEIIRFTKKQNEEKYYNKLQEIEQEIEELRRELLLYPEKEDHKLFYSDNNSRNSCLFNKSKITGKLDNLDELYNEGLTKTNINDAETELINMLERYIYEKEEDRLAAVLLEEKKLKKLK